MAITQIYVYSVRGTLLQSTVIYVIIGYLIKLNISDHRKKKQKQTKWNLGAVAYVHVLHYYTIAVVNNHHYLSPKWCSPTCVLRVGWPESGLRPHSPQKR